MSSNNNKQKQQTTNDTEKTQTTLRKHNARRLGNKTKLTTLKVSTRWQALATNRKKQQTTLHDNKKLQTLSKNCFLLLRNRYETNLRKKPQVRYNGKEDSGSYNRNLPRHGPTWVATLDNMDLHGTQPLGSLLTR